MYRFIVRMIFVSVCVGSAWRMWGEPAAMFVGAAFAWVDELAVTMIKTIEKAKG